MIANVVHKSCVIARLVSHYVIYSTYQFPRYLGLIELCVNTHGCPHRIFPAACNQGGNVILSPCVNHSDP
jgi:hypothetical protein